MSLTHFGKVAVLFGGVSAEREVSLKSGARVLEALQSQGIDAHAFDPATQNLNELAQFDRAFVILHGRHGEDGTIQGALELMRIPYTGSGVMASALAMDKWRTKLLWQAIALPVPEFVMLDAASDFAAVEKRLGLPLFVKPVSEGSSIGVSIVRRAGDLPVAYAQAAQHDSLVMAEQAVLGGEYTVVILGDGDARRALPIIKIEPATEFYDYDAKYLRDDTLYRCPCGLSSAQEAQLQTDALEAFRVLGCRGWGRVDFLLDTEGKAFFLEANTLPGMTDHSLVPMAARAAGISFEQLAMRILASAALG